MKLKSRRYENAEFIEKFSVYSVVKFKKGGGSHENTG